MREWQWRSVCAGTPAMPHVFRSQRAQHQPGGAAWFALLSEWLDVTQDPTLPCLAVKVMVDTERPASGWTERCAFISLPNPRAALMGVQEWGTLGLVALHLQKMNIFVTDTFFVLATDFGFTPFQLPAIKVQTRKMMTPQERMAGAVVG